MASNSNPACEEVCENICITLHHLQIVKYITVASLAFNIWDLLISFLDEVRLVWVAPVSWVKCLFLLNRYLGPSILIVNLSVLTNEGVTESLCRNWFRLEGWGGLVVVVVVQIILISRVIALYERSNLVSRILVIGLLVHVATCMVVLGLGLERIQPIRHLGSITAGCIKDMPPSFFLGLFIPHLVMASTLFSLTVIGSAKNRPKGNWYSAPLLMLLLRDGTMYFFAIFAVTCITTFAWLFAPASSMKISIAPLIAISSVSGCRLILNLRVPHNTEDKAQVLELSLASFDLGELEMRTLPRKTTSAFGDPADVSGTPHVPPLSPEASWALRGQRLACAVEMGVDLEDWKFRTSGATDYDGGDWDYSHRFAQYPDRGTSRWSGKWAVLNGISQTTFDSSGRTERPLPVTANSPPHPMLNPSPLQSAVLPTHLYVRRRGLVARLPLGLTRGTAEEHLSRSNVGSRR